MSRRKQREAVPIGRTGRRRLVWIVSVLLILILGAGVSIAMHPVQHAADPAAPQTVAFAELSSFPYTASDRKREKSESRQDPIPREIRALDGKRIQITGYMVPLQFREGKIESFYLSRAGFQCCYADAPKATDFIRVSLPPGQFVPMADLARVSGVLEVGEEWNSAGWVDSVYRLRAESVAPETAVAGDWADYTLSAMAAGGVGIFLLSFGLNIVRPWLRARHILR
jgi:hypothetical protein